MVGTGSKLINGGVAFITGAASGIGQATAFRFAKHGAAAMALSDVNIHRQAEVSAKIQDQYPHVDVLTLGIDTSNEESVINAHQAAINQYGRIDYAVNNAGVPGVMKMAPEMTSEEFKYGLDINLTGVWLGQREQIRQMLRQNPLSPGAGRGSIVNLSSIYGFVSGTNVASYCASKHAVLGVTRAVRIHEQSPGLDLLLTRQIADQDASDFAKFGIRINAVCPGYIETPMVKGGNPTQNKETQKFLDTVPIARLGRPEEIADAIVFLSSCMSTYITGTQIVVDGGFLSK